MTLSLNDSFEPDQRPKEQHKPKRKKRKDAGQVRWQQRDYYVLRWIGAQGAIRYDQLRVLLGRESPDKEDCNAVLSPSATDNAIKRWETKHFINSAHIVPGEPMYYWLSKAGFQFIQLYLPYYSPKRYDMPSLLACNQTRLHMELLNTLEPQLFGDPLECFWVSQRQLLNRDPGRTTHAPSGEYKTRIRGTLAIEVVIEPTVGREQEMRDYAQGKLGTYSEVWYFALSDLLPDLRGALEKLGASGVDVSKIHLFRADTLLIPPTLPR